MFNAQHHRQIAISLRPSVPRFTPGELKSKAFQQGREEKFTEMLTALTKMLREDNPEFDVDKFHESVFKQEIRV